MDPIFPSIIIFYLKVHKYLVLFGKIPTNPPKNFHKVCPAFAEFFLLSYMNFKILRNFGHIGSFGGLRNETILA